MSVSISVFREMVCPFSGFLGKAMFSLKIFFASPQAKLSIIVPVSFGPKRIAIPLLGAIFAEVIMSGETAIS